MDELADGLRQAGMNVAVRVEGTRPVVPPGPTLPAVGFRFTERRPSGRLGRYVESVWHARGQIPYTREKIAPTGSTVAGIVPDSLLLDLTGVTDLDDFSLFLEGYQNPSASNQTWLFGELEWGPDVVWLFLFVSIYVWGGWGAPIH